MRVTIRANRAGLRKAFSFALSAALHGAAVAWMAMGASLISQEKPKSIYDEEIKPHRNHIIWYSIHNRLPDVKPSAPKAAAAPLRAIRKFNQQIVSKAREDAKPPQTILAPAPEIRLSKPLPLPNVLAVAAVPKPVRAFVPPPERRIAPAPAKLPDAPTPLASVAVKATALNLAQPKAPPLPFKAPPDVRHTPAAPVLPAAPAVANAAPRIDAPRIPKAFTPPPEAKRSAARAEFSVDAPPPDAVAPPALKPSLIIAGLKPVEAPEIPTPPGSHEAGFSAGTKPRLEGSDTDTKQAALTTPGLLTRGGAQDARAALIASLASPTSTQSLMEGMRRMRPEQPAGDAEPAVNSPKVSRAPDPRLEGRAVYVVALQMPNITSFSGSWLMWFAEHERAGGRHITMTAPFPIRKVDPKYIVSARQDHVEGSVRLFAIIRKTGHVDSVELLQHLDDRLDRSATEALLKWEFEPAKADGVPVDVEAVFEIPFHLEPRPAR
jgi:TonB family protein